MLDINMLFKIAAAGILIIIIEKVLKSSGKEDISTLTNIAGVVIILLMIINLISKLFDSIKSPIGEVITFLKDMSSKADIDSFYITLVLKIVGITYIATFATEICKEAGAQGIASRIELAAKILILVIAMPILMGVLDAILKIM